MIKKLFSPGPLTPLLLITFTGTTSYSIVLPFLVFLVTDWGGNALIFGIVSAAYSFFQLIGAPILGRWSDRHGRKRVLLFCQVGTLVGWLVALAAFHVPRNALLHIDSTWMGTFTLTIPLMMLFLARSVDGISGGSISVANAYAADITPKDKRSESFGRLAASSNLGYIVGPAMAAVLGGTFLGYELPILGAVGVAVLGVVMIVVALPESKPSVWRSDPASHGAYKVFGQEHKSCSSQQDPISLSTKAMLQIHGIPVIMAVYFLVTLAFSFFYVAFPYYVLKKLNWTVSNSGIFFSVMSLFMVITQGPVLKYASNICSPQMLMTGGSVVLGTSFLFYTSDVDWLLYLGALLMALGNGVMWPSVTTILAKYAGDNQGAVQGFAGSVGAFASIVGLLASGCLYNSLGTWVFVLAAGMVSITTLMSLWLLRDGKRQRRLNEQRSN